MDDDVMPRHASEWLVALSEEPDDADLQSRFALWLQASPAHARDWEEISRTHRVMGEAGPVLDRSRDALLDRRSHGAERVAARRGQVPVPARARPVAPSRRRVLRTAALAALAACLAIVFVPRVGLWLEADHLTQTAAPRTIRLEDGSVVHLAAETAIAINFEPGARQVKLLKGEAFFEVAADAARPFSVIAGSVRTTVLGTAFDVRLRDDGADVGVEHGHVRVEQNGGGSSVDEHLRAGDWVRVTGRGETVSGRSQPENMGAWRRGEVIARDRPVSDVIDAIRPYYDGLIIVTGARFAEQPLTGVYRLSDPVEAVRAVARAEGATVRQISPWVLIVSGD